MFQYGLLIDGAVCKSLRRATPAYGGIAYSTRHYLVATYGNSLVRLLHFKRGYRDRVSSQPILEFE
jgi:hypothetical protein